VLNWIAENGLKRRVLTTSDNFLPNPKFPLLNLKHPNVAVSVCVFILNNAPNQLAVSGVSTDSGAAK
jgi:hypothetical protein